MTKRAKLLSSVKKKTSGAIPRDLDRGALLDQYNIIREDLMKLRDDLTKGYDMAKGMLDKKTIMKELMRMK